MKKGVKWNCKRSVITHGGRDIKRGDILPAELVKSMGKDRIKAFKDSGQIVFTNDVPPDNTKSEAEETRAAAIARAKDLEITHNSNLGTPKLQALIDAEEARLVLLAKARDMKLDVADDASAEDLKKAVEAVG